MHRCILVAAAVTLSVPSAHAEWGWMRGGPAADFTDADWNLLKPEARRVLDEVDSGVRVNWKNPDTGAHGAIKALMTFEHDAQTCRRVAFLNISPKGRRGQGNYNLCQQPDGEWKFIADSEISS